MCTILYYCLLVFKSFFFPFTHWPFSPACAMLNESSGLLVDHITLQMG